MTVITSSRLYGQTSRFTIWENCKIRESKQLLRPGRHEWQPVVCLQFALWNTSTWHNKFESFCFNYCSMTLSSQTIKKEKRTTYGCYFWRTGRHLCRYLSSLGLVTFNGLANTFTICTNQSDLWKSSYKLSWNWYQWWRREMSGFFFLSRANTCQKHNKKGRKTRSDNTREEKTKQGTQPLHRSSFCFENVSLTSPVFRLLSNRI